MRTVVLANQKGRVGKTKEKGLTLILLGVVIACGSAILSKPAARLGTQAPLLDRELVIRPGVLVRLPQDRSPAHVAVQDIAVVKNNARLLALPATALKDTCGRFGGGPIRVK